MITVRYTKAQYMARITELEGYHGQLQQHPGDEGPDHGGVRQGAHAEEGLLLAADIECVEQLAHGQGGKGHGVGCRTLQTRAGQAGEP